MMFDTPLGDVKRGTLAIVASEWLAGEGGVYRVVRLYGYSETLKSFQVSLLDGSASFFVNSNAIKIATVEQHPEVFL